MVRVRHMGEMSDLRGRLVPYLHHPLWLVKVLLVLMCLHAVEDLLEDQIQRLTGSLVGLAPAYDSTQPPGKPASTQGWTPDVGELLRR